MHCYCMIRIDLCWSLKRQQITCKSKIINLYLKIHINYSSTSKFIYISPKNSQKRSPSFPQIFISADFPIYWFWNEKKVEKSVAWFILLKLSDLCYDKLREKRERQIHKHMKTPYMWEYTDTTMYIFLAFIIEISSNNSIHSSLIHLMSSIFSIECIACSPPSSLWHQMRPT